MHLAPTASRRVYQQRIGRIMRMHPRKEAGVVVDFVPKGATHNERVVSLHSLLDADFYREGARVTPAPRRRPQRRARRKLSPAPWLVPVTPDVKRRLGVIAREWQRVDPRYLDEDEQRFWAQIAGRQVRFEERVDFVKKLTDGHASRGCLEQFLFTCAAENPNRRLRMTALADRVSMGVDRASFDDLVTLVTQAPTWEKDRAQGVRILLRGLADGKADAPEQILWRWTWRLARATRKIQDRRASAEYPEAKRLLGALALVLLTPRLVDPADCSQMPKALPGSETRKPDDFEFYLETILEAPRGVGWAVLKVVTLGRYRGFRDGDVLVEGLLGLVTIAASCFLVYRWWPVASL
jgi:hypothetical protein